MSSLSLQTKFRRRSFANWSVLLSRYKDVKRKRKRKRGRTTNWISRVTLLGTWTNFDVAMLHIADSVDFFEKPRSRKGQILRGKGNTIVSLCQCRVTIIRRAEKISPPIDSSTAYFLASFLRDAWQESRYSSLLFSTLFRSIVDAFKYY